MILFPAIDLYDGKAVRLYKGDYAQMTVYSHNPIEIARDFEAKGATWVHLVDLEGAKDGTTPNLQIVKQIANETSLCTEIGGGIRNMETVRTDLENGVNRVILGTAAVNDEAFLKEVTLTISFQREERNRHRRIFTVKIASGLSLIFLGVLMVVLLGVFEVEESLLVASVALLLALVGVACYLFITAGILNELFSDPEKALMSEEEKKGLKAHEEAICSVIMTLATAIFLFCGFKFDAWHPAWIAFPIGGVLCGGVSSVLKLCGIGKSDRRDGEESEH